MGCSIVERLKYQLFHRPAHMTKEIMEQLAKKLVKREKESLEQQIVQFCSNAIPQLNQFKMYLDVYNEEADMYLIVGDGKPDNPGFPPSLRSVRETCQQIVEMVDKLEAEFFPPDDPLADGVNNIDPLSEDADNGSEGV